MLESIYKRTPCLSMKIFLTLAMVSLSLLATAQQDTSKKNKISVKSLNDEAIDQAALIYPRIRQLNISHLFIAPGNINSKMSDKGLFSGKIQTQRTNINMNLPILDTRKNSFITSFGVVHQFTTINQVESLIPGQTVTETENYIPMMSLGATFSHRDTLFNHPITFTGLVSGLFNPSFSRQQITFTGLLTVPIIKKQYTRLTVGLVVNIDPSSPIPAFLLVSYFHKFKESNMDLIVDAPYRIALRKSIKSKSSIAFQTELGGNNSFFSFDNSALPNKLTFSTLEIKTGFLFEYRATKKNGF